MKTVLALIAVIYSISCLILFVFLAYFHKKADKKVKDSIGYMVFVTWLILVFLTIFLYMIWE